MNVAARLIKDSSWTVRHDATYAAAQHHVWRLSRSRAHEWSPHARQSDAASVPKRRRAAVCNVAPCNCDRPARYGSFIEARQGNRDRRIPAPVIRLAPIGAGYQSHQQAKYERPRDECRVDRSSLHAYICAPDLRIGTKDPSRIMVGLKDIRSWPKHSKSLFGVCHQMLASQQH